MLVNVPGPKRIYLAPSDRSAGLFDGGLNESLLVLGDRGRRRYRLLLHVRHKFIERGQGSPLEKVIQVEIVSGFKDSFESSIERLDAVHLSKTPSKVAQCLRRGLAPS